MYRTIDRIRDYIGDHKETIIKVAVVVAIAAIISAIMVLGLAASKGAIDKIDNSVAALDADVDGIMALGSLATVDQLESIGNRTQNNQYNIGDLQTRLGNVENLFNTMQNDLAEALCSPPEGYLTGTVGNYTLHARASKGGNFTANVHLVYSPPLSAGNATTQGKALQAFYESIDWAVPYLRDYVCTLTYSDTAWGISRVSFNIGTFTLEANTERTLDIIYSGLNSTYEPDFAYVELYPILE